MGKSRFLACSSLLPSASAATSSHDLLGVCPAAYLPACCTSDVQTRIGLVRLPDGACRDESLVPSTCLLGSWGFREGSWIGSRSLALIRSPASQGWHILDGL